MSDLPKFGKLRIPDDSTHFAYSKEKKAGKHIAYFVKEVNNEYEVNSMVQIIKEDFHILTIEAAKAQGIFK